MNVDILIFTIIVLLLMMISNVCQRNLIHYFQVIYVVDSSSPEKIGPSTVDLIQLMSLPALKNAPFLIVFTKTDLSSAV